MMNWGRVALGTVLPFMFTTYDGATGASEEGSGLAVTDIEIYKAGGGLTQRSSDTGYALLDADGHALDSIVGLAGFTIDTGDNTDAGFFVAGGYYIVVVSSVTVDTQTVNFIAGTFSLGPTLTVAGVEEVDLTHIAGSAVSTSTAQLGVNAVQAGGTAWGSGAITAASIASDAITDAKVASDVTIASVTGAVGSVTGAVGSVTGAVGSIGSGGIASTSFASGAITAAAIATDAIGAAELAADAVAEIADAVWDEAKSGHVAIGTYGLGLQGVIRQGTCQTDGSADSTHLVLDASASATDDLYNGFWLAIISGTGSGQSPRSITDYVGSTKRVTLDPALTTNGDSTTEYAIFN